MGQINQISLGPIDKEDQPKSNKKELVNAAFTYEKGQASGTTELLRGEISPEAQVSDITITLYADQNEMESLKQQLDESKALQQQLLAELGKQTDTTSDVKIDEKQKLLDLMGEKTDWIMERRYLRQ